MAKHERPSPYPKTETSPAKTSYMTPALYDKLKFVAQILLPAVGTLYFVLAGIWGLAAATQVIGSITAVDTFLGVILGISSSTYNKSEAKYDGHINVQDSPDGTKKVVSMELTHLENPHDVVNQKELLFKVNPPSQ